MPPLVRAAVLFMVAALVFYSVGVWATFLSRQLPRGMSGYSGSDSSQTPRAPNSCAGWLAAFTGVFTRPAALWPCC